MNWYFMQGSERKGPVNLEGLRELLHDGTINNNTFIWNKGLGDQWAKVADVPALAGLPVNHDDPEVKADFQRKLEERKQALREQKAAGLRRAVIATSCIFLLIAGIIIFIKGGSKREWGISSAAPIGSIDKLERRLIDTYKMEKKEVDRCEFFAGPADKIYVYSDAKADLGKHVSGKGTVTVAVDGKGCPKAILGTFPSPGLRGPSLNNRSAGSVMMNDLWTASGGAEEKALKLRDEIMPTVKGTGFVNIPSDAVCQILEAKRMRGIWCEFGENTRFSMVYFEVK